jgi:hypothetical protein
MTRSQGDSDSLVQGALVDLFSAYAVPVAPLPRSSGPYLQSVPDISASLDFKRRAASLEVGRITLSLPRALLDSMKPGTTSSIQLDWARELTNQLAGRLKNRLLPFDVRLELGMPAIADQKMLSHELRSGSAGRVYPARCVRGQLLVTVRGVPDDAELTYVGGSNATEGSTLFF